MTSFQITSHSIPNVPPSAHAATLIETRQGLLVAWFAGTHEGHPDVAIWAARFTAEGWSQPTCLVDVPGVALWNPVLFRAAGGEIWLFYKIGATIPGWSGALIRSRDDGLTWSPPRLLPSGLLGPAKNKPIQLHDGSILCPTSAETWNSWTAWVELSRDGGRSWQRRGPITAPIDEAFTPTQETCQTQDFPGVIQPAIWEYAPGQLRMALRSTRRVSAVCLAESLDGGQSWSAARKLTVPNPNSGLDAVRLADGCIALVCNPVDAGRTPLSLLISEDNGETFPQRVDLETREGEYSYPSVIQSRDGALHVVATYQRRWIEHYRIHASG